MNYQGKWALITGASAGLGAQYAKTLASKGANIVLVARRRERLDELAAQLRRENNIETRVFPGDLSDPMMPMRIVEGLEKENIGIDILINNAGYGLPGNYLERPWEDHRDFLELMVTSYAHLVRLVLPGMVKRGYGRIIQVASLAGLMPGSAGHTMYGASKAFLISYSQSLAAEWDEAGVKVCAVCPGFTYTEFHDANSTRGLVSKMPGYMFMQAEPVIEGSLGAVESGHVVWVPGTWNKFVAWLMKALPRPWAAAIVTQQSKAFRRQE